MRSASHTPESKEVNKTGFCGAETWVRTPATLFIMICVILDKFLNLLKSLFPHLWNGTDSTCRSGYYRDEASLDAIQSFRHMVGSW